jgi:hypothetical protein
VLERGIRTLPPSKRLSATRAEKRRIGDFEETRFSPGCVARPLRLPVILIDGMKNLFDECFTGFGQTQASMSDVEQPYAYRLLNTVDFAAQRGLGRMQTDRRARFTPFLRHCDNAFQLVDDHVVAHPET